MILSKEVRSMVREQLAVIHGGARWREGHDKPRVKVLGFWCIAGCYA